MALTRPFEESTNTFRRIKFFSFFFGPFGKVLRKELENGKHPQLFNTTGGMGPIEEHSPNEAHVGKSSHFLRWIHCIK